MVIYKNIQTGFSILVDQGGISYREIDIYVRTRKYSPQYYVYGKPTERYYDDCDAGLIKNIRIESDPLYPEMIELITKCLMGKRFSVDGIMEANDMFRGFATTRVV